MTSKFKHLIALALVGVGFQTGVHAAPTFEHVKKLDFGTGVRVTAGASDDNGTVFFVNNMSDAVYYMKPFEVSGDLVAADAKVIHSGSGLSPSFGSSSYSGITINPATGDLFAAGPRNPPTSANAKESMISKFVKTGVDTYTITQMNIATPAYLAGVKAVGPNQFAFSDANTGNIKFYELNETGTGFNPIGEINSNTDLWSPTLAVDSLNKKIYQGVGEYRVGKERKTGKVHSYNFDFVSGEFPFASGTYGFTGTSNGVILPGDDVLTAADTATVHYYQSVSVSSDGKFIAVAHNPAAASNASTDANSFKVYDTTNLSAPVITLDGSQSESGVSWKGDVRAYGSLFFKNAGKEYLLIFFSNVGTSNLPPGYSARVNFGYIYEVGESSDIQTWEMY